MNRWSTLMPPLELVTDRSSSERLPDRPAAVGIARFGQRGQVLIIFAGALVALMILMAMVVDIGWYWSNNLKIQRAADAAALAGAVYLPDPGDGTGVAKAQAAALLAAKRNGYVPSASTTLTSAVDGNNPRQLDVTITDKVGTFFLKVAGIQTLNAGKSSKAEFVLPVPMGSPQNYYGLGTFVKNVQPADVINPFTNNTGPTAIPGTTVWGNAIRAFTSDNFYATSATNNQAQIWKTFNFGSFPTTTVDGLTLTLEMKDNDVTGCQVRAEVSWNNGGTWGNLPQTTNVTTNTDQPYILGSQTDETVWGNNHVGPWSTANDFTSANFQVRLTYLRPAGCTGTVSLDQLTATVFTHTTTTPARVQTTQTVNGPTGSVLGSQGFWGAAITLGGQKSNGDQFDPIDNGGATNTDWDGKGVDYTVNIAGPGGQLKLFDPTFCETGPNSGGGSLGAGDHWIGGSNPVTTVFSLYDQHGTPYDTSDDLAPVATTGTLFADEKQTDDSGDFGTAPHTGQSGVRDCSGDAYHNAWYSLATGLPTGTYRLNVSTNQEGNTSTNAENMWSAWVTSTTGNSQIFGQGKMVTYNNLLAGTQLFYLAQIDKVHAGKTMEIKLYDPGDVSGNATMRILSPDGNAYSYVNFTYSADNGRASPAGGVTVSSIQTAAAPNTSFYQGALITITIPLPTTYGSVGLTPSTETTPGWWKVEYTVDGGNDTTSWQVDIQGNPVHLLVP